MNKVDYIGKKIGKLTIVAFVEKRKGHSYYLCKCDCGNEKTLCISNIVTGNTKSCGCIRKIGTRKTHGLSNTRIHHTWCGMKQRCYNINLKEYKYYGARGIKVCKEWIDDFMNFYNWAIDNGYNDDLSIDRIDVNGDYEPDNCRWVTQKEQVRNVRTNKLISYNNETKCLSEWCEIFGLNYKKTEKRLREYGWSFEEILKKE